MPPRADDQGPKQISYSTRQALDATGLSEHTIRQLVRDGKIAARYYGSKLLIDAESLERFYRSLPSQRVVERDCAANER